MSQSAPSKQTRIDLTSWRVSITGNRCGRFARTTPSTNPICLSSTSLYKNNKALRARFWVGALTLESVASAERNRPISASAISKGCLLLWKNMLISRNERPGVARSGLLLWIGHIGQNHGPGLGGLCTKSIVHLLSSSPRKMSTRNLCEVLASSDPSAIPAVKVITEFSLLLFREITLVPLT